MTLLGSSLACLRLPYLSSSSFMKTRRRGKLFTSYPLCELGKGIDATQQSDDFTAHGSNSTCFQQAILLTDIFGKMRCTRSQFDGAPLDVILMKVTLPLKILYIYAFSALFRLFKFLAI